MGKKERKKKIRGKKEGEGKFAGVQNQQRKSGKERGNKTWLFLEKKKRFIFRILILPLLELVKERQ